MSWKASQWAIGQQTGSSSAKGVLLVLGEAADASGYCFLSQQEIADRAEIARRSVVTAMALLEERRLVARRRRFDAHGNRTSDGITLQIDGAPQGEAVAPSQGEAVASGQDDQVQNPSSLSAKSVDLRCNGCTVTGHEPVNEPKEDSLGEPSFDLCPEEAGDLLQIAVDEWNVIAKRCGLPTARLTDKRREKLQSTLDAHGITVWRHAVGLVETRPFLLGDSDSGWKADLDFLLKPDKFTRLIEGGYAGRRRAPQQGPGSFSALDQAALYIHGENEGYGE